MIRLTLSEAGISLTKLLPMKGTFYKGISNSFILQETSQIPYLEDVLLYPGNAGGVEDNGEESNSTKSTALQATAKSQQRCFQL